MASQLKTQPAGDLDIFVELPRKMGHGGGRPAPRIDGFEVNGMIELIAEVPGVPGSAIDVHLDGDTLTIEVDKGDSNQGKNALFTERVMGRFRRSIQLPFAPDPATVEAALQDGLLTIRFPRLAQQRHTHRIEVHGSQYEASGPDSAIGSNWADRDRMADAMTLDVKATEVLPRRGR